MKTAELIFTSKSLENRPVQVTEKRKFEVEQMFLGKIFAKKCGRVSFEKGRYSYTPSSEYIAHRFK